MVSRTFSWIHVLVICGTALIACICVYMKRENLYYASQVLERKVESIIMPVSYKLKEPDAKPYKIPYDTKDGLMKIHRDIAQIQFVVRQLLAPNTKVDMKGMVEEMTKYQLPLTNELFNTIQDLVRNNSQDLKHLQNIVSDRIDQLQNPSDCSRARKFLCKFELSCGLGCIIFHLAECFLISLGTGRTLVADLSVIRYEGMKKIFMPLSTCSENSMDIKNIPEWQGEMSAKPTLNYLPFVKHTISDVKAIAETKFLPLAMPSPIAAELIRIHSDPNAWWIGQLFNYIMRLQPSVIEDIEKVKQQMIFSHPIVGVHVRRNEKTKDKNFFFEFPKYMRYVDEWYEQYEIRIPTLKKGERKVYLATDDYGVLEEARKNYKNYIFLHNPKIKEYGTTMRNRYTEGGLLSIMTDITILSQTDYFVGTLSSNVGCSVYTLMQSRGERTFDAMSLDTMYRFHRGFPQYHIAIANSDPKDGDMELKVGDKIKIQPTQANYWRGFGYNERTKKKGAYSMMKVKYFLKEETFAAFP